MVAQKLGSPPEDIRTEWRRLDQLIGDVESITRVMTPQSHLVHVELNDGGLVFDFTGLINALKAQNINL
ncbi:MAG: hypothetical protein V7609_2079 [Verrucomicrobiota bacterium]